MEVRNPDQHHQHHQHHQYHPTRPHRQQQDQELKERKDHLQHLPSVDRYLKKFPKTEIIIENIALGSENKEVSFKQFNESSSSTLSNINEQSKYFKKKFKLLNFFSNKKVYGTFKIKIETLSNYLEKNNIDKVGFLKIDTEGYEYEILKGMKDKIKFVDIVMFEHHYDNMIKKNYTFVDINELLKQHNFKQIYKSKMPFRKTFEYIYCKGELLY